MLDLKNIDRYRENNRIEAKRALGGLPQSIWETYSSFANTLGGYILLGVEENKADKTLYPIDLPAPEKLVAEFMELLNNPKKVSTNILSTRDIYIQKIEGKRIIVIRVPRADRQVRPIFVDGTLSNTYRRNGDGDYRCTAHEISSMQRDSSNRSTDMHILENKNYQDVFLTECLEKYRVRLDKDADSDIEDYLIKNNALMRMENGKVCPVTGSLLMFGKLQEILKVYPRFSLEYKDEVLHESFSDVENLFEFYCILEEKLKFIAGTYSSVFLALKEALINAIFNADYYGETGLTVYRTKKFIRFSNPGSFRVRLTHSAQAGISDPRNAVITGLFHRINIGKGIGTGLSAMYSAWKKRGWSAPVFEESFNPEKISLTMFFTRKLFLRPTAVLPMQHLAIIDYLTDYDCASKKELANLLGMRVKETENILTELLIDDILEAFKKHFKTYYRLRT